MNSHKTELERMVESLDFSNDYGQPESKKAITYIEMDEIDFDDLPSTKKTKVASAYYRGAGFWRNDLPGQSGSINDFASAEAAIGDAMVNTCGKPRNMDTLHEWVLHPRSNVYRRKVNGLFAEVSRAANGKWQYVLRMHTVTGYFDTAEEAMAAAGSDLEF